eukprot:scaffold1154_cov310-Pinguiococcus_pyrenoidosus.AAC.9
MNKPPVKRCTDPPASLGLDADFTACLNNTVSLVLVPVLVVASFEGAIRPCCVSAPALPQVRAPAPARHPLWP